MISSTRSHVDYVYPTQQANYYPHDISETKVIINVDLLGPIPIQQ